MGREPAQIEDRKEDDLDVKKEDTEAKVDVILSDEVEAKGAAGQQQETSV